MVGLFIVGGFTAVIAFFLLTFERPKKLRGKITGRGGDFES